MAWADVAVVAVVVVVVVVLWWLWGLWCWLTGSGSQADFLLFKGQVEVWVSRGAGDHERAGCGQRDFVQNGTLRRHVHVDYTARRRELQQREQDGREGNKDGCELQINPSTPLVRGALRRRVQLPHRSREGGVGEGHLQPGGQVEARVHSVVAQTARADASLRWPRRIRGR